jgi:hypothetical protein
MRMTYVFVHISPSPRDTSDNGLEDLRAMLANYVDSRHSRRVHTIDFRLQPSTSGSRRSENATHSEFGS